MLCQRVRGTCFVAEYPLDKPANGADLQMWTALGRKNQVWVLEEFSSWLPRINTTIKTGGRYKITNEQTKLALDLSGVNSRSIIGHVSHGGANQQWVIEQQLNGQYIIRSVAPSKFLCIEKTPDNGARLAGLDSLQFWDIEILPGCDAARPSVKFCQWIRGTCFVADYPIEGQADVEVQVCTPRGGKNQVWVLEEYH
ncbi:hypothetical protein EDB86DRAFT_637732 [Lactarius hatsudake]|nr:hypothetical protein EDB86DRAFT_637732 [Lactarius hatsudake]